MFPDTRPGLEFCVERKNVPKIRFGNRTWSQRRRKAEAVGKGDIRMSDFTNGIIDQIVHGGFENVIAHERRLGRSHHFAKSRLERALDCFHQRFDVLVFGELGLVDTEQFVAIVRDSSIAERNVELVP